MAEDINKSSEILKQALALLSANIYFGSLNRNEYLKMCDVCVLFVSLPVSFKRII